MSEQPPYDLVKREPAPTVGDWRRKPTDETAELDAVEQPKDPRRPKEPGKGERYWTESRILRLGSLLLFVAASSIATVKIGEAFPGVAWLPYVVVTLIYGAVFLREMEAHHASEEGARLRAERRENSKLRVLGDGDENGRFR